MKKWLLPVALAAAFILGDTAVFGGATYSRIKTWITGETLTASDLNAEFNNILNNFTFSGLDDYSATATEMRSTADPYPAGSESLATSGAGELERIRYVLAQVTGETYWYQDPDVSLTTMSNFLSYRRPVLKWVSVTTVDVENNTGTANETKVMFPDGTARAVTEDTSSTSKYRRFIITEAAEFTSGTENSGMLSGESEAVSKWYAIYAVKSAIDSSKFVLAATTNTPTQGNYSTLNTRFGTNGWVYLGLIRNGDGDSATGDILDFDMAGNATVFANNTSTSHRGLRLAHAASATSVTYTYAAGTGAAEIPSVVTFGTYLAVATAGATNQITAADSSANRILFSINSNSASVMLSGVYPVQDGLRVSNSGGANVTHSVYLNHFVDGALGVGSNPQL